MVFEKNLNGIRALAVMSVIFFHYQLFEFNSGFVGVDIFFFLSGYLMTKILTKESNISFFAEYKEFIINRLRRVLPGLAVLIFISFFLFFNKLPYPEYINFCKSIVASLLFTSNNFFASESDYFAKNISTIPLVHTWSLSIEFQFYITYSFSLLLVKHRFKPELQKIYWLLLLSVLLFFMLALWNFYVSNDSIYYCFSSRVWEFLAGGLFSYRLLERNKNNSIFVVALIDLILFALLVYSFTMIDKTTYPNFYSIFPVLLCVFLFLNKSNERSLINKILNLNVIQFVGYISYSLYLWHWVAYVFIVNYYIENDLTILNKLTILAVSFLLSTVSYYLIELPVKKRQIFKNNSSLLIFWLCFLVLFVACVFIGFTSNANYNRLPEHLKSAEIAIQNINPRRKECFLEAKEAKNNNFNPVFCKIGTAKERAVEVLLWGDSHADSLQPVVDKVLFDFNKSGVVSSAAGCAPVPKSAYSKEIKAFEHCQVLGENTQKFINSNLSTLKIVIFHANWGRYDFGILKNEMLSEFCFLKKNGIQPVVIGQVPIPPWDIPIYWFNRELKSGVAINNVDFDQNPSSIVNNQLNTVLADVQSSCGDIVYVNPEDIYCQDSKCFGVKNGVGLYYDITHLSVQGSLMLYQYLHDSLGAILNK